MATGQIPCTHNPHATAFPLARCDKAHGEVWLSALLARFCWQFITLAGFHVNALALDQFAKAFRDDGMRAYARSRIAAGGAKRAGRRVLLKPYHSGLH